MDEKPDTQINDSVVMGDINIVSNDSQEDQIFSGFQAGIQGLEIVEELLNPQISDLQIWVADYSLGFEKLSDPNYEYRTDEMWLNLSDETEGCFLSMDYDIPKGKSHPLHRIWLECGSEKWKFETIYSMSADFIFGMLKLMLRRDYEKLKTILDWKPPDN